MEEENTQIILGPYMTTEPFAETTANSSIKYNTIIDDLMSKSILFKLNNGYSLEVDGRVIKYSSYLKNLSCQCKIYF